MQYKFSTYHYIFHYVAVRDFVPIFSKARAGGRPLPLCISVKFEDHKFFSNFPHRKVHKPVRQLNDVCHVHITVDRIELVAAQHSGMQA